MFIDAVPESEAAGSLADYYTQQKAAWGFLPNYAAAFSTRPDVAQAWNTLNATVRDGMDRRRFEIATPTWLRQRSITTIRCGARRRRACMLPANGESGGTDESRRCQPASTLPEGRTRAS